MPRRFVHRLLPVAVALLVVSTARPLFAQMSPRPPSEPPLSALAFPEVSAELAPAPAPAPTTLAERYPYLSIGVRAGAYFFVDSDTEEIYGALPLFGIDAKIHLFSLPLAIALAADWSYGTGELDDDGGLILESDADIEIYSIRLSLILEPPPGALGSETGGFYVTPYLGVGIGLNIVEQDVDGETTLEEFSDSSSESVVGYHVVVGIDFVFARLFSVGVEGFWTTAVVEDAADSDENLDIGGFGATLNIRLHF